MENRVNLASNLISPLEEQYFFSFLPFTRSPFSRMILRITFLDSI